MISPHIIEHQLALFNTLFSRANHFIVQTESALSLVSGIAILAIVVPLVTVFALDFAAYLSSMLARSLAQHILKHTGPKADILASSATSGFVFKINSSGLLKDSFQSLGAMNWMRLGSGFWLKIADEEH